MPTTYFSKNFDIRQAMGQFILTAEPKARPPEWTPHESGQWRLFTRGLSVADVYDQSNRWLGWCIGHLILDGKLHPETVILRTAEPAFTPDAVEDFYQRASGKWALLLVAPGYERIFLDPYGSLATVYSQVEKTVASTPTLIGTDDDWDEALIQDMGLPKNDVWLPAGLTAKKNVKRLLPNHSLHLAHWSVSRHWPTPETNFSVDPDIGAAVTKIVNNLKSTIAAVAAVYPICFSVTAGRDSRMLLACARNYLDKASFFTFRPAKQTPDMEISTLLAKRFQLNHRFISRETSSPEEANRWLARTGLSVAGSILKLSKTIDKLDPACVLLPGMAGEVGRAYYWKFGDKAEKKLTAADVLSRCSLPHHPILLQATEAWVAELKFVNTFVFLDLLYIEQRLGCWAAPQHYGNTTSPFEFTPFNSRLIFHTLMRMPYSYRRNQHLAPDICKAAWPELLQFPFNQFTGIKGFILSKVGQMKTLAKKLLGR